MEYDNKNSFVLFKNDKKASPKAPDFKGTYTDNNGKEWEVAAWEKTSKAGNTFLSGKISEKRDLSKISYHNKAKGNAYQPQVDDEDINF